MASNLNCAKCGAPAPEDARRKDEGWAGIFGLERGLEIRWYCPLCFESVKAALAVLQSALGDLKVRHANFSSIREEHLP